jgi:hypothetical protein
MYCSYCRKHSGLGELITLFFPLQMKFRLRGGVNSRCYLDVVAGATDFVISTVDEIPAWDDVVEVEAIWML